MKVINEKKLAKLPLGDYLKQLKVWEVFAKAANMVCGYKTTSKKALQIKEIATDVAMTDGSNIFVNINNSITGNFDGNENKTFSLLGLIAHEAGHIKYSDFELLKNACESIDKGEIYHASCYEESDFISPKDWGFFHDLQELLKNNRAARRAFKNLFCNINNIFEDEWMECRVRSVYHGDVKTSLVLNRSQLAKDLEGHMGKKDTNCGKLFSLLMGMVRCDVYDVPKGENKEWHDYSKMLHLQIASVLATDNSEIRMSKVMATIVHAYPLIKEELDINFPEMEMLKMPSTASSKSEDSDEDSEEQDSENASKDSSNKEESETNESSDDASGSNDSNDNSKNDLGEDSSSNADSSGKEESETSESSDDTSGSNDSGEDDSSKSNSKEGSDESEDEPENKSSDSSSKEPEIEMPIEMSEDAKRMEEMAKNDALRERISEIREESSFIKNKEDILTSAIDFDSRLAKILQKECESVNVADIHEGAKCQVFTNIDKVNDEIGENDYTSASFAKQLKLHSTAHKMMLRSLEPLFHEEDEVNEGVYFGDKLSEKHLFSAEDKFMLKEELASEERKLAIGLLVDQSASMSSNNRTKNVREFSILLYDVCKKLNIPLAIWGHGVAYGGSAAGKTVLPVYSEFDKTNEKAEKNLAKMRTLGCDNRDGYAIHLFGEHVAKRPEEHKLLIVLSDGQPADGTSTDACIYSGCSDDVTNDMKNTVTKLKRAGVTVIAGAIGNDRKAIKSFYGENKFLDMTDFETIPKKITRLIQRQVM